MPDLNLNFEGFQRQWFALQKPEQMAVLKTLKKLIDLTWEEVYRDPGLNWELARDDRRGRFYSLRVTQKCRAFVQREGNAVIFVSLHPDHDSAY
jgi:hypothetical protein